MKVKETSNNSKGNILNDIFREIRLLRNEVSLLIPTEDIKEYENHERIKSSYNNAIKQYPISS